MLVGFFISVAVPCALLYNNLDKKLIVLISIANGAGFAWFSIFRVMNTLDKIKRKLVHETSGTSTDEHDELCLIEESLDHFSKYAEKETKI